VAWIRSAIGWQSGGVTEQFESVGVRDVRVGDTVRFRESVFTVARIDQKFLGMDAMVCLIEDTPARWHAYPAPVDGTLERRLAG
jgi:hypothetical protein